MGFGNEGSEYAGLEMREQSQSVETPGLENA